MTQAHYKFVQVGSQVMNRMELETEHQSIHSCLRKIEAQLGWGNSIGWSTQEFELLSKKIQEATGIALSVATLKRIWGKVQYASKPNVTTLNALAQYLGHENWQVFKQLDIQQHSNGNGAAEYVMPTPQVRGRNNNYRIWLTSLIVITCVLLIFYFYSNSPDPLINANEFQFSSKKVIDEGVPNTVIFDYDATAASPTDSVFIQQSWDKRLSTQVARDQHQHTSIYYHPGFFEAKLRINQTIVKRHNLFITTKGWTSLIDQKPVPVYFKQADVIRNGVLGITLDQIQENNIPLQPKPPHLYYYNMNYFGEARSGDLIIETNFKNTYGEGANVCQFTEIRIQFEGGALIVPLSAKGCVSELKFMNRDGKKSDLSALGCDFNDWVKFKVAFLNKTFSISINEKQAFEFPYESDSLRFVGLGYGFEGTGTVDFVKVSNHKGKIFYEETF